MIGNEQQARDWLASRWVMTPEAMERLEKLVAMLAEENERQNLVAAATIPMVWQRHIVDSAQLLAHVPRETWNGSKGAWLDLGTGAGFPGLVIAAMRPGHEVLMVESRARRVEWLNRVIEELALPKAQVLGQRLEMVETRTFAVISARAFAPLDKLLKISARFSTRDTIWLLPKGRSAGQELEALKASVRAGFHVEQSLTDEDAGLIVGHLNPKGVKL
ncbi:16S rRNA (guanine(527)-N(7))-methyltransferase RsmG [Novosphingobium sp. KACC 22771]|uniref:16S rRNA (guanine(527)-N(7))-methyltransferase RsmG n=1 Tax=Novosphingobium sp. KACC 22771 TaxID=3025670 RepID=UPI0023650CB1|nr:16S rRNA (guanine(527)-N(7))-methyltransferase RsmG [Novosphingobium sp. KACC 22771]WDF72700.1 16S rRNA (guanine(527)-N(7))-methyltransferase RsmG [Novosphingobium sp. KACC 22771]